MPTGSRLFEEIHNRHQLAHAVERQIPTVQSPTGYPRAIASLIREMLAKSANQRPTLVQVSARLSEISLSPTSDVPKPEDSGDPYQRFRQVIANREDVRREAEREREREREALKKRRWDEFEHRRCRPPDRRRADHSGRRITRAVCDCITSHDPEGDLGAGLRRPRGRLRHLGADAFCAPAGAANITLRRDAASRAGARDQRL